jgi:Mn2+/Fe2+ NRAMP family transporter
MREILVAILTAFGIALPPDAFLSGLFLALAGAYLMTIFVPEKQPVELRWMLALAVFVATCLAMVHTSVLPVWPIQLKMALGGALSRWIVRIIANKAEARAQESALPPTGESQ